MTDMLATITPKSDQLNADDLIGGRTLTIKITGVTRLESKEQPISLHYEGDNGKPYKPGLSMRRVLVSLWGRDGNAYVGRSMTLYRDEKVIFGGVPVGGIRISHMSDISKAETMALTASKAKRSPFTVRPLVIAPATPPAIDHTLELLKRNARDNALNGYKALQDWTTALPPESRAQIKPFIEEYKKIASDADAAAERAGIAGGTGDVN